jgi:TolA-binding protein
VDAGDFEGALRLGEEALEQDPAAGLADAAVFDLALLSVHYGNPKKDYRKALSLFRRLVKDYPHSQLVDEARIWIGVLESIERAKRIDIEIEEKKKEIAK